MARKTEPDHDAAREKAQGADESLSPEERIAELETRCAELEETALRAQADYKNLRRRALGELELGVQRQMQPLLEELLLVLDFLDMALASPAGSQEAKNLVTGVQMTRTKLVQALEAADVREIPIDGPFDPAVHEATATRDEPEAEPGSIVTTVRKGYTWQGRVLRPAQVVVAAGAPAAGTGGAPAAGTGGATEEGPEEDRT